MYKVYYKGEYPICQGIFQVKFHMRHYGNRQMWM